VFLIGLNSGLVENFAYVRLREIGASGYCLGQLRLLSTVVGGPMFYFSGHVTKRLGIEPIMLLSFASFAVRFLIYGLVSNPWFSLPAELLRGLTFATFWAGCTYYVYQTSPSGLTSTMVSHVTTCHIYLLFTSFLLIE
jgi:hypothetical protein